MATEVRLWRQLAHHTGSEVAIFVAKHLPELLLASPTLASGSLIVCNERSCAIFESLLSRLRPSWRIAYSKAI